MAFTVAGISGAPSARCPVGASARGAARGVVYGVATSSQQRAVGQKTHVSGESLITARNHEWIRASPGFTGLRRRFSPGFAGLRRASPPVCGVSRGVAGCRGMSRGVAGCRGVQGRAQNVLLGGAIAYLAGACTSSCLPARRGTQFAYVKRLKLMFLMNFTP